MPWHDKGKFGWDVPVLMLSSHCKEEVGSETCPRLIFCFHSVFQTMHTFFFLGHCCLKAAESCFLRKFLHCILFVFFSRLFFTTASFPVFKAPSSRLNEPIQKTARGEVSRRKGREKNDSDQIFSAKVWMTNRKSTLSPRRIVDIACGRRLKKEGRRS